ncbi:MFS transporter [Spongiactinospora sp. TRM90649]|uniref:MFS transporter n=1 Tax=Spongiactinospora sp. TRM90649 TaxID=3031114 RepID=UPI0023F9E63D|nr:MFS transporter [Spongiactinospora sp. TRM90649]MDF5754487.1 hypothetical protein [Spongiactinospora sp. TRM90649]
MNQREPGSTAWPSRWPPVLLGLPFGVLVDRVRHRRSIVVVLVLATAAGIASVALANALDSAGWSHIVAVMMMTTVLMAMVPIGQDAWLPSVVSHDLLVPANAALTVLPAAFLVTVVPALTPVGAIEGAFLLAPCVLLVIATVAFGRVDAEETPPPRGDLWREVTEGVRFTLGDPVLRAIALYLVLSELFLTFGDEITGAMMSGARRDMSTGDVYTLMVVLPAVVAPLVGAALAVLLYRRLGTFRLAWTAVLVTQPCTLLLALPDLPGGSLWYLLGTGVPWTGTIIATITLLSHRQTITPDRLLGRVGGVLLTLVGLAALTGRMLEAPAGWFAETIGPADAQPYLLPGLVLATLAGLAPAVPLLRVRHAVAAPQREPVTPGP